MYANCLVITEYFSKRPTSHTMYGMVFMPVLYGIGTSRTRIMYWYNDREDGGDNMSEYVHPTHLEEQKGREWSILHNVLYVAEIADRDGQRASAWPW